MLTPTFDLTPVVVVVVFAVLIDVVSVVLTLLTNHGPTQIHEDIIGKMV